MSIEPAAGHTLARQATAHPTMRFVGVKSPLPMSGPGLGRRSSSAAPFRIEATSSCNPGPNVHACLASTTSLPGRPALGVGEEFSTALCVSPLGGMRAAWTAITVVAYNSCRSRH